ncbi:MAG TPA: LON peptidase substrate-binding domain-containing protein, partial [Burkholderiaceae bacterium]|nr:LON peptidase substrate-binding domain-containing protein [Burkholderiaceae bacterium]
MIGELPLFPLQAVLFPGGLLSLKVFEARYLDLVGRCLREKASFGVVCLRQGSEVQRPGVANTRFEHFGVLAQLDEVDAEQAGILRVRCTGTQRFRLSAPHQPDDGLWLANAETLPDEVHVLPSEEL